MGRYPDLFRPLEGRIRLEMPYAPGNRAWLKEQLGERIRPDWVRHGGGGHWEVARNHLRALLEALVDRWGAVDVVLDFNVTEKCDRRCQTARGDDCTCSCLGVNHRGLGGGKEWFRVGDTTLISSTTKRVRGRVTRQTLDGR